MNNWWKYVGILAASSTLWIALKRIEGCAIRIGALALLVLMAGCAWVYLIFFAK